VARSNNRSRTIAPSRKSGYIVLNPKERNADCASGRQVNDMKANVPAKLKDGASCKVIGGTHEGKSGIVRDIKTGKTGHVSITVIQANGVRFKTLAKNVETA
jgi:ribosomal protein S4E